MGGSRGWTRIKWLSELASSETNTGSGVRRKVKMWVQGFEAGTGEGGRAGVGDGAKKDGEADVRRHLFARVACESAAAV